MELSEGGLTGLRLFSETLLGLVRISPYASVGSSVKLGGALNNLQLFQEASHRMENKSLPIIPLTGDEYLE